MSRPEVTITWAKIDDLLRSGCTGVQAAASIGIHPNTFYRRVEEKFKMSFSDYAAEKKAQGQAFIKYHQYQKALGITKKGDNGMLVWVGKQLCGQKENGGEEIIAEEVTKAFDKLMNQLDEVQAGNNQPSECIPITEASQEKTDMPFASPGGCPMGCINPPCKESPFR